MDRRTINRDSRRRILAIGYCPKCGREILYSGTLGYNCLMKQRERMRIRQRLKRGIPLDEPVRMSRNRTEDQRAHALRLAAKWKSKETT